MILAPADGSRIAAIGGEVTFDFSAVADRLPERARIPLVGAVSPLCVAKDAAFKVTGLKGEGLSVVYDERRGCLMLKQRLGLMLILR